MTLGQSTVNIDGRTGYIQPDGMVQFGNDQTVNVSFYKKQVLDKQESQKRGRPFYTARNYIRIQQPGERDYTDRPVEEIEGASYRWPRQWAQFKAAQEQTPDGTPVEMLFVQRPEISANLHTFGVHTIEQLALVTEEGLNQIGMGGREWKNLAIKFLNVSDKGADFHKMKRQNEELQNQLEVQSNQIAALQAQINRLMAKNGGVPEAMIPQPKSASIAQDYVGTLEDGEQEEASSFPSPFGSSPDPSLQQPRRGWPKGKPRKTQLTS